MPKKVVKKKKKQSVAKKSPFGFNNTITSSIMTVILFIVTLVVAVTFVTMSDNIKSLQSELSSDFISNIKVFEHDVRNKEYHKIQEDLNNIFEGSYKVSYVVVLDKNLSELYSSFPEKNQYMIRQESNPASFRLRAYDKYSLDEFRTIYIPYGSLHVYIGVFNSVFLDNFFVKFTNFMTVFIAVILLACFILAYMLSKSISTPLLTMEETVSKIANGDLSGRLEYTKFSELNQLVQAYNQMANTLQRLYSTLESQVQDRTQKLKSAIAELQNTQAMMVHSEKMKSLGELVAGIMHEINNPINFIYGNMTHLGNYSNDLIEVIETYSKLDGDLKPEQQKEVKELKNTIDYEFLKSDMPDLIKSCKEGADRAKNIIQDLKSFSRMEEATIVDVNVPQEIDTTLNILHNKIKNKAEIHKEYMENVPKVEAFGGQLNQVFMNILDNAVGAIKDKGDIWIRINLDSTKTKLLMEIEDNGIGMDEETSRKVFNPFFTTKPVGQGTGLGMSITYKIIKNHQGEIDVTSQEGKGTKFTIKLPLVIDREFMEAGISNEGANN